MKTQSAWQAHKKTQCKAECWYCNDEKNSGHRTENFLIKFAPGIYKNRGKRRGLIS